MRTPDVAPTFASVRFVSLAYASHWLAAAGRPQSPRVLRGWCERGLIRGAEQSPRGAWSLPIEWLRLRRRPRPSNEGSRT